MIQRVGFQACGRGAAWSIRGSTAVVLHGDETPRNTQRPFRTSICAVAKGEAGDLTSTQVLRRVSRRDGHDRRVLPLDGGTHSSRGSRSRRTGSPWNGKQCGYRQDHHGRGQDRRGWQGRHLGAGPNASRALDLCTGLPAAQRRPTILEPNAGHYGIFAGKSWRENIRPCWCWISSTPICDVPRCRCAPSAERRDDRQVHLGRGAIPSAFHIWTLAVRPAAGFQGRGGAGALDMSPCDLFQGGLVHSHHELGPRAARDGAVTVQAANPRRHGRLRQRRRWHPVPGCGRPRCCGAAPGVSGRRAGKRGLCPPSRSATPPRHISGTERRSVRQRHGPVEDGPRHRSGHGGG